MSFDPPARGAAVAARAAVGGRARAARASVDLCDRRTVRAVARRAGIVPSRRLGQHFLVDRSVLERITDALELSPEDEVFEVGPGMGTLTRELALRAHRVVAVDLDQCCLRAAASTLRGFDNVELVRGDALRTPPDSLGLAEGWVAAGNIPYSMTTPLLERLFSSSVLPSRGVFLVQREVGERLAAEPGGWSLATLVVRSLASVERLGDVPPSSFEPPPAVHSTVVRLRPRQTLEPEDRDAVLALARSTFQMRRKQLRHGLTHALAGDAHLSEQARSDAGIAAERRPETLDLDEWQALAAAVRRARRA